MNLFTKKYIILVLIICSFSVIVCKKKEKVYHLDPESYLVEQFADKKIIMLADIAHENPLPYQSVISVLNKWLDKIENKKIAPFSLTLVLERDSVYAHQVNKYLDTGSIDIFLDSWLPSGSLETLEFLSDLRKIKQRILKINQQESDKIDFETFGAEFSNMYEVTDITKLNKSDSDEFYISKRDSLAARNITNYLKHKPDQKVLIFYGNAHLIKNNVDKYSIMHIPGKELFGYFMAYYLKHTYGDDLVLSINQARVPDQTFYESDFAEAEDQSIYVESKYVPWVQYGPEHYDAFILRHETITPTHPLSLIFSRRIVEQSIERMKLFEPYLPGYGAKSGYYNAVNILYFLTGNNYKTVDEWVKWYYENGFKGFERLQSKEFDDQIFNYFYTYYAAPYTRKQLNMLGFGSKILNREFIPDTTEWKNNLWPKALKNIKILNAIGINWIGYPDEKEQVKEILHTFNDKELSNPEYLKYWRKTVCKADY